jgi:hypothetical protein
MHNVKTDFHPGGGRKHRCFRIAARAATTRIGSDGAEWIAENPLRHIIGVHFWGTRPDSGPEWFSAVVEALSTGVLCVVSSAQVRERLLSLQKAEIILVDQTEIPEC